MHFKLLGEFKPYVRMTQRSLWNNRAQAYLSSQAALKEQFKEQCGRFGKVPGLDLPLISNKTPLAVHIRIQSPGEHHHSDIDNQAKALLDAAQGIVFKNDMWIDSLEVRRETGPDYCVEFEVEIL